MMITHDKNDGKKNGDRAHYKVLPLMQRPKSIVIYQKWLRSTKLQHFFSLAGIAIVTVAKGLPNDSFWCCNRFSPIATPRSVVAMPCSVATHIIGNHRGCCKHTRCCRKYLLPHTQSVAIGVLATILGVAIDLIATHQ